MFLGLYLFISVRLGNKQFCIFNWCWNLFLEPTSNEPWL